MNNSILLKAGGIGLLLFLIFRKTVNTVSSSISLLNASVQNVSLKVSGVELDVKLQFRNTGDISVNIDSFQGALYYGQTPLANLFITDQVITANATETVGVETTIAFDQLANGIVGLITSGQWLNNLSVAGYITSNGIRAFYRKPIITFG